MITQKRGKVVERELVSITNEREIRVQHVCCLVCIGVEHKRSGKMKSVLQLRMRWYRLKTNRKNEMSIDIVENALILDRHE